MILCVVFVFFFSCSFAAWSECTKQTLRIGNLTFHAGWDDGSLSKDPDVRLTMKYWSELWADLGIFKIGISKNVNSLRTTNERDVSWREFWDYDGFSRDTIKLQISICDEEFIDVGIFHLIDTCKDISDMLYDFNVENYRTSNVYKYFPVNIVGSRYNWNLKFYMSVYCNLRPCSSRFPWAYNRCQSPLDSTPCYVNELGNGCTEKCGPTEEAVNGRCRTPCDMRMPDPDSTFPCGEDCYFFLMANDSVDGNETVPTCNSYCPISHTHQDSTTKKCTYKECRERVFSVSQPLMCGPECYRQLPPHLDDPLQCELCDLCNIDCPNPSHIFVDKTAGRCMLKECDQRSVNTSTKYPCGEANCYQQMENGIATDACLRYCASFDHTFENNGRCVFKSCDNRSVNTSASYPCGEASCYQQMENGSASNSCGSDCPSNHTTEDNTTGRCVFKDCDQRVYDPQADYPCGEANCYQQMENGISTNACGLDCVSNDHTIADNTTGKCVLMDFINTKSSSVNIKNSFKNIVVLSIVVPLVVLAVVIVLIVGCLMYSKKKKNTEKKADRTLVDMNSLDAGSTSVENTDSAVPSVLSRSVDESAQDTD